MEETVRQSSREDPTWKYYRFAVKIHHFLAAIPLAWKKDEDCAQPCGSFKLLHYTFMRAWMLLTTIRTFHAAWGVLMEGQSPSRLILCFFVGGTYIQASAIMRNTLRQAQPFIDLISGCKDLGKARVPLEEEAAKSKGIPKNNGGWYMKNMMSYVLTTPMTMSVLYAVKPHVLPNYGELLAAATTLAWWPRAVYALWLPLVAYEWAFVVANTQFYMYTIILYCKETIWWLRYLMACAGSATKKHHGARIVRVYRKLQVVNKAFNVCTSGFWACWSVQLVNIISMCITGAVKYHTVLSSVMLFFYVSMGITLVGILYMWYSWAALVNEYSMDLRRSLKHTSVRLSSQRENPEFRVQLRSLPPLGVQVSHYFVIDIQAVLGYLNTCADFAVNALLML